MTTATPLTTGIQPNGDVISLSKYEEMGGYQAFRKVLRGMTPSEGRHAPYSG